VQHAKNDADTLIVSCALHIASQQIPVTVIADDTDVLVLLIYHFKSEMADIYMLSEITRRHSPRTAITPVSVIRAAIGEKAASQLLVAHAISECDSTSGLFGHGKANVFRSIVKFVGDEAHTDMLESISASCQEVVDAGLKLITMLYGGKEDDTLNHLRYVSYMHQLATRETQPHTEKLPPTENAAKYHILRVHLQAIQWQY